MDDSNGNVSGFFETLGEAWPEALLTAELTADEREDWAAKLEHWAEELEEGGIDDAFHTSSLQDASLAQIREIVLPGRQEILLADEGCLA